MKSDAIQSMHTSGPWTWWTSNSWRRLKHDNRGKSIDVLQPTICRDGQPDLIVSEADMALIAAAPDLLVALEILTECHSEGGYVQPNPDVLQCARAAIAKAKGR